MAASGAGPAVSTGTRPEITARARDGGEQPQPTLVQATSAIATSTPQIRTLTRSISVALDAGCLPASSIEDRHHGTSATRARGPGVTCVRDWRPEIGELQRRHGIATAKRPTPAVSGERAIPGGQIRTQERPEAGSNRRAIRLRQDRPEQCRYREGRLAAAARRGSREMRRLYRWIEKPRDRVGDRTDLGFRQVGQHDDRETGPGVASDHGFESLPASGVGTPRLAPLRPEKPSDHVGIG